MTQDSQTLTADKRLRDAAKEFVTAYLERESAVERLSGLASTSLALEKANRDVSRSFKDLRQAVNQSGGRT